MPSKYLTPRTVDSLKGRNEVYFDTNGHAPKGFCLRFSASGEKRFYLIATMLSTSQRRWISLGPASGAGLKAARDRAIELWGQIVRGIDPNDEKRKLRLQAVEDRNQRERASKEPTVAEVVRRYLDSQKAHLSPVTVRNYSNMIKLHLEGSTFGNLKAKSIVRSDVRTFIEHKAKKTPRMADYIRAVLHAAWGWARVEESAPGVTLVDPDRDPMFGLKDHDRRKRTRHLSDDEIVTFWRGLDEAKLAWGTFAKFILLTGLRRGECYAACWSWVDWNTSTLHVPAEVRKGRENNRQALDVPLCPLALRLLREMQPITGKKDRIFRAHGISIGYVGGEVKKRTGLKDLTIHDIRRSCSSGLQRIGCPSYVISVVLGHATEAGATQADSHYVHGGRPSEHKTWLTRWSDHVAKLIGEESTGSVVEFPQRMA